MKSWVAVCVLLILLTFGSQALLASVPRVEAQQAKTVVLATPNPFFKVFVDAFKKDFPDADVNVIFRGTTDVLKQVRAEKARPSIDVWWGGGIDAFETAKKEGLLEKMALDPKASDDAIKSIPAELAGLPLYDKEEFYYGYTVGGFGIMWNTKYLTDTKVQEPREWDSLASPIYRKHIVIADPARSGSTLAIVEIILQGLGWEKGWALLKEMSANIGTFTARSSEVPDAVSRGDYGVGLVIDFFAFQTQQKGAPTKFVYPTLTIFNADSVALVKGSPNQELGKKFINWLMGKRAQTLLYDKAVFRPPIRKDIYDGAPAEFPNPFGRTVTIRYDSKLGASRNTAVPAIFSASIINRHSDLVSAVDEISTAKKAIESAPKGVDLGKSKALLNQATKKLSAPPVQEAKASEINERLAKDSTFLASQSTAWSESSVSNYRAAVSDAREAVSAIPPLPATIAGLDPTFLAISTAIAVVLVAVAVLALRPRRGVKAGTTSQV